jgi:cysteine synthase B
VHGLKHTDVYAKLEYYNPFGSVKDRIAKEMLDPQWKTLQKENRTVIESSSGNTGKAIAALCSINSLPFKTITNRIKVPEQRMVMQLLGAEIEELPGFSECPDPSDPNNATTLTEKLTVDHPGAYYFPNQYTSQLNVQAHEKSGTEILSDLENVDYFVGFLGTSGSTLGAGKTLKKANPNAKIIGVIAESYNHIPGGREAQELWEVGLFEKSFYTSIEKSTVQEAIDGLLTLVRKCGIMCGPTSGANYAAAIRYLKQEEKLSQHNGQRKKAVFIACDRIEPYMSYLEKHRPNLFSQEELPSPLAITAEEITSAPSKTCEQVSQLDSTECTIIDIRGNQAYAIGHIPGSINIVDSAFQALIDQGPIFPMYQELIIACRSGETSKKFVAMLQKQGYSAFSLAGGIASWKSHNLPLMQSNDAECYVRH